MRTLDGLSWDSSLFERVRPPYPMSLVAAMAQTLAPCDVVVDIGSGTGKLTAVLEEVLERRIVAVEPSRDMYTNLARSHPGPIAAIAEALPFRSGSVKAIFAGHAAHWFVPETALAEFERVLTSDGRIVLLWNRVVGTSPDVTHLWRRLRSLAQPPSSGKHWFSTLENAQKFDVQKVVGQQFERTLTKPELLELLRSGSQMAEAIGEEKRDLERRLKKEVECLASPTVAISYSPNGFLARVRS